MGASQGRRSVLAAISQKVELLHLDRYIKTSMERHMPEFYVKYSAIHQNFADSFVSNVWFPSQDPEHQAISKHPPDALYFRYDGSFLHSVQNLPSEFAADSTEWKFYSIYHSARRLLLINCDITNTPAVPLSHGASGALEADRDKRANVCWQEITFSYEQNCNRAMYGGRKRWLRYHPWSPSWARMFPLSYRSDTTHDENKGPHLEGDTALIFALMALSVSASDVQNTFTNFFRQGIFRTNSIPFVEWELHSQEKRGVVVGIHPKTRSNSAEISTVKVF